MPRKIAIGSQRYSEIIESGAGHYDIMLISKNIKEDNAIIIEFKVMKIKRGEKNPSDTLKNALSQIDEKHYEQFLLDIGVPSEHILKYGFAFEGKEVLIGESSSFAVN